MNAIFFHADAIYMNVGVFQMCPFLPQVSSITSHTPVDITIAIIRNIDFQYCSNLSIDIYPATVRF